MINWTSNVWRYRLDKPFEYRSKLLLGVEFANSWVTIKDSVITIKEGYAWDGCSPTWHKLGLWWGVPDGLPNAQGIPPTYHASLVHDAFCQFNGVIPIDKASVVAIFKQLMLEGGVPTPVANVYATAVNLFGPQQWSGLSAAAVKLRAVQVS